MNIKGILDNILIKKNNYILEKDLLQFFLQEKNININEIQNIDKLINILEEKKDIEHISKLFFKSFQNELGYYVLLKNYRIDNTNFIINEFNNEIKNNSIKDLFEFLLF